MTTQTPPDGEATRKEMLAALSRIKTHTITLEDSLTASIKANGEYAAEIVTVKSERDAALARVEELAGILENLTEDSAGLANECGSIFQRDFEALRARARAALKEQS